MLRTLSENLGDTHLMIPRFFTSFNNTSSLRSDELMRTLFE